MPGTFWHFEGNSWLFSRIPDLTRGIKIKGMPPVMYASPDVQEILREFQLNLDRSMDLSMSSYMNCKRLDIP